MATVFQRSPLNACSETNRPASATAAGRALSLPVTVTGCQTSTLRVVLRTARLVEVVAAVIEVESEPSLASVGPSAAERRPAGTHPPGGGAGGAGTYIDTNLLVCSADGISAGLTHGRPHGPAAPQQGVTGASAARFALAGRPFPRPGIGLPDRRPHGGDSAESRTVVRHPRCAVAPHV